MNKNLSGLSNDESTGEIDKNASTSKEAFI